MADDINERIKLFKQLEKEPKSKTEPVLRPTQRINIPAIFVAKTDEVAVQRFKNVSRFSKSADCLNDIDLNVDDVIKEVDENVTETDKTNVVSDTSPDKENTSEDTPEATPEATPEVTEDSSDSPERTEDNEESKPKVVGYIPKQLPTEDTDDIKVVEYRKKLNELRIKRPISLTTENRLKVEDKTEEKISYVDKLNELRTKKRTPPPESPRTFIFNFIKKNSLNRSLQNLNTIEEKFSYDKEDIRKKLADDKREQEEEQARVDKEMKRIEKEMERVEKEREEKERAERERKEREERERAEKERAEKERVEKERAEKERVEKERAEKERAEKERAEKERVEKERAEKQRAEKERVEKERAEKERVEKERAEKERVEKLREMEKQEKKIELDGKENLETGETDFNAVENDIYSSTQDNKNIELRSKNNYDYIADPPKERPKSDEMYESIATPKIKPRKRNLSKSLTDISDEIDKDLDARKTNGVASVDNEIYDSVGDRSNSSEIVRPPIPAPRKVSSPSYVN